MLTKHIVVQVESNGLQLFRMVSNQITDVESRSQQAELFSSPPSESNSVLQLDLQLGKGQGELQVSSTAGTVVVNTRTYST